jgi:hypothetical protein
MYKKLEKAEGLTQQERDEYKKKASSLDARKVKATLPKKPKKATTTVKARKFTESKIDRDNRGRFA